MKLPDAHALAAEAVVEADCLIKLIGDDPAMREKLYNGLTRTEKKIVAHVFQNFANGALVVGPKAYKQQAGIWKKAMILVFKYRKGIYEITGD